MGLPVALEGWKQPTEVPYEVPFSVMVPEIILLVQEYVKDSVAYLKGLINPGDVLPAACTNRDRILKVQLTYLYTEQHLGVADNVHSI